MKHEMSCRVPLLAIALVVVCDAAPSPATVSTRAGAVEDFEGPTPVLLSYPGQDLNPTGWEVTSSGGYGGTPHALRLFGNTWKIQEIAPRAVADTTVWEVAVFVSRRGEIQAFGVGDGVNELLYTFAGEDLPQESKWWTVYQGAYPLGGWHLYRLPLGQDWHATYGYHPQVDRLFYINDDDSGVVGEITFDEIGDVTEYLPRAPQVIIHYVIERSERVAAGVFRVGVQFHSSVYDPDSPTHRYTWDFGDHATSDEPHPQHVFVAQAGYTYTVALTVTDPGGLTGADTCQVAVEPGQDEGPIIVNFVGDVMTARAYESAGGIIDDHGVASIFAPTFPIFGGAADLSVCNLECSYTDRGTPHPTKSVVFRSRPENIAGIVAGGVDVADVGNNHIIDYGEPGMAQTLALLDSLGIRRTGAGTNAWAALQPAFASERGVRLGFLGLSNRCGRLWNYQPFLDAGASKPGFAYLLPHNLESAIADTRAVADVVIVQLHSGSEYVTEPPASKLAGGSAPPPDPEANAIVPGLPDISFCVEPSPGDRALRRLALDCGADIVINHHPHVLQGFESYHGKLIAHSLGNFVFDLYYPETMPTLVLALEIEKNGITGYTFTPAWIDDYVPQPVTGRLAREIMDRLADYSRPMNALVAVDPAAGRARICLERGEADSSVTAAGATVLLVDQDGWALSPPIALAGVGNLSAVTLVDGPGTGWEVSWGREILWHGGYEAEGATLWALDAPDEWLDASTSHSGARSLALRRLSSATGPNYSGLERLLPCRADRRHTAGVWLKTDNAANSTAMARFYSGRATSTLVLSTDLGPRITGTQGWQYLWREPPTPASAAYCQLLCTNDRPASGVGHAWFDDGVIVEWEPWEPWSDRLKVAAPNNFRFVQVRRPGAAAGGEVTVEYEETAYGPRVTGVTDRPPATGRGLAVSAHPNPFNSRTNLVLRLPATGGVVPVQVALFDVRGRRVTTLFQGELPGGTIQLFSWDGLDARGQAVASGVYAVRARAAGQSSVCKVLLLR